MGLFETLRHRFGFRWRHPLVAIVGGFLVASGLYLWATPPFEGPDEAQHFAYVTWLADGRGLPPQGAQAATTPIAQESGQPPLYYWLASLPARLLDRHDPAAVYRPNPHFMGPLPRSLPDNDNRAVPLPPGATRFQGGWLALTLARMVTILAGAVLVTAVYGLSRQVLPGRADVAAGAAFLAAFTPQVLFISSVVSNDVPAAALTTVALWRFARALRDPAARGAGLAALTGVALGLAGLTKVSALLAAAPLAAGLAWLWLTRRWPRRQVAGYAAALLLATVAVAGWWFGRNWLLYAAPLGLAPHDATPWSLADPGRLRYPAGERWLDVARSFLLALGWGTVRWGGFPGGWPYSILWGLLAAAAAGLALLAWRRRRPLTVTVALLGLLLLHLLVTALFLELWNRRVIAPYGRLLFPALGAVSLLLVLGWRALHPRLPWLGYTFVAGLALVTPFTLMPAYFRFSPLPPAEAALLPAPTDWFFGATPATAFARLLSVTPAAGDVRAGQVAPVQVCWQALDQPPADYSMGLQIIGPDNSLVAGRRSYPGHGVYPTSAWQAGAAWCEWMHVYIAPGQVSRPLLFKLELFLWDDAAGRRLPAFDARGERLAATFAAAMRIAPAGAADAAPVTAAAAVGQTGPMRLLGFETEPRWTAGATHQVALNWQAQSPVDGDYQAFAHLLDAAGDIAAQADGPPLDGWYPTSHWLVGEIVTDRRRFRLPPDLPPGQYRLQVGFYDLLTGARLGPPLPVTAVEVATISDTAVPGTAAEATP